VDEQRHKEQLANAGWEPDGTFSEHLAIGNKGDLCILVPQWVWRSDDPMYELYDVERNVSCWVAEVPTPEQAAQLLQEYGEEPEE
jgi:hypothetical protein